MAIANPRSQNGALGRRWPEIRATLATELGAVDHALTKGPGDAARLCRAALADGADIVVAVGGDGTVHEVANGFFDAQGAPLAPHAALGVIPFGTGGDFRKTAGIPKDLRAAARVLRADARASIDVGRLDYASGGRHGTRVSCMFINIASFGMGGLVDRIVNTSSKALGGKASFLLATTRAALRYRNQRVRLVFDDRVDEPEYMTINNVAVANGRYFGGGMHIAPHARLDDGQFDVVALGDLGLCELLTRGHRVYKGTHLRSPKTFSRRARRLEATPVDPPDEILLDVDGEALGALPATFTLVPRALSLIVPPIAAT